MVAKKRKVQYTENEKRIASMVAENIKMYRMVSGISIKSLAEALERPLGYVHRLEKNGAPVDYLHLIRVCNFLGTDLESLFRKPSADLVLKLSENRFGVSIREDV